MSIAYIFKTAWEVFRTSILVNALGMLVLFLVITGLYIVIFPMLLGIPLEEISRFTIQTPEQLQSILISPDFQIKFTVFMLLINCIIAPMTAGFYSIFGSVQKNELPTMKQLFSFYNSPYTARILGSVLVITAVKTIISILLNFLGLDAANVSISILISLLVTLTIPIIIFENLSLVDAMRQSSARIAPFMFTVLLALAFGIIMGFSGILVFVVGICFTLPFFYAINYALYAITKR
ncbi:beta-carotene 15,15'-monooxygenase [Capnocytophaga canis]|uniref:beta-carotene 15,15'-monooxygenase n=1 Tax=Capnocytophaga canis TaxID=1848903 RepID=UPI00370D13FB